MSDSGPTRRKAAVLLKRTKIMKSERFSLRMYVYESGEVKVLCRSMSSTGDTLRRTFTYQDIAETVTMCPRVDDCDKEIDSENLAEQLKRRGRYLLPRVDIDIDANDLVILGDERHSSTTPPPAPIRRRSVATTDTWEENDQETPLREPSTYRAPNVSLEKRSLAKKKKSRAEAIDDVVEILSAQRDVRRRLPMRSARCTPSRVQRLRKRPKDIVNRLEPLGSSDVTSLMSSMSLSSDDSLLPPTPPTQSNHEQACRRTLSFGGPWEDTSCEKAFVPTSESIDMRLSPSWYGELF